MPRKREFPRLRRLQWVTGVLAVVMMFAGSAAFEGTKDAVGGDASGWWGLVVGAPVLALALIGVVLIVRRWPFVAARERADLRARGADDDLPVGAFREGDRIGLEASDLPWGFAIFLGLCALLVLSFALTDARRADVLPAVLLLAAFGLPAASSARYATGVKYWLSAETIDQGRWPGRSIRWSDVAEVTPIRKGARSKAGDPVFDVLELKPVAGRRFMVRATFLAIGKDPLQQMIRRAVATAHES